MKWLLILWPMTGGDLETVAALSDRDTCEQLAAELYESTGRVYLPCTKFVLDDVVFDVVLFEGQEQVTRRIQ